MQISHLKEFGDMPQPDLVLKFNNHHSIFEIIPLEEEIDRALLSHLAS